MRAAVRAGTLLVVAGACLLGAGPSLGAQSPQDSAAVEAVALDYIEGWFTGDAERLASALHADLVKEIRQGGELRRQSAEDLVSMARGGGGGGVPPGLADRVEVLALLDDAAAVRIDAPAWTDLLHLVRTGEGWKILHVLWELREP